jgi:hypothetical protein
MAQQGVLQRHHLLWKRVEWGKKPYSKLRNHHLMSYYLDPDIHHELHYRCLPIPTPPYDVAARMFKLIEECSQPIEALIALIDLFGALITETVDEDREMLYKVIKTRLSAQLEFLHPPRL